MFKHKQILQFSTSNNTLESLRPFIAFPMAFSICFFYFLFIDISTNSLLNSWLRSALLLIACIAINIIYCYIEYTNLSSNLQLIVTSKGFIKKHKGVFYTIPWDSVKSITEWTNANGWEINIDTEGNTILSGNTSSKSTLVINNANKPFYLRNSCQYYLEKLNILQSCAYQDFSANTKTTSDWKYLRHHICYNLIFAHLVSIISALVWFYFS